MHLYFIGMATSTINCLAPTRNLLHQAKQQHAQKTLIRGIGMRKESAIPNLCAEFNPRQFLKRARIEVVASSGRVQTVNIAANVQEPKKSVGSGKLDRVPVTFSLKLSVNFGEKVALVGSPPELGSWDPSDSLMLKWSEGNVWEATVELDTEFVHEFKSVVIQKNGNVIWQPTDDNARLDMTALTTMLSVTSVRAEIVSFDKKDIELFLPVVAEQPPVEVIQEDTVMPVVTAIPKMPVREEESEEQELQAELQAELEAAIAQVEQVNEVKEAEDKSFEEKLAVAYEEKEKEMVKAKSTDEEEDEDTQITAEMGGTMILRREPDAEAKRGSEGSEKKDNKSYTALFLALGLAGLVAGVGAIKFAATGTGFTDGIKAPTPPSVDLSSFKAKINAPDFSSFKASSFSFPSAPAPATAASADTKTIFRTP